MQVADLKCHAERVEAFVAAFEFQVEDVRFVRAENTRHHAKRAGFVFEDRDQFGHRAFAAVAPCEVDPVGVDAACQHRAINGVDGNRLVGEA